MKTKKFCLIALFFSFLIITGCGNKKEYYDYANKCFIYMLSVLHGETSVQEDIVTSNKKETVTDIEYTENISEIGGSDVDTD